MHNPVTLKPKIRMGIECYEHRPAGVAFGDGPLPCTGPDGEAYFEAPKSNIRVQGLQSFSKQGHPI